MLFSCYESKRNIVNIGCVFVIGFLSLSKKDLTSYLALARLDKPWGIVLLAWPTLSALILTDTKDLKTWVVFILGIVLTRSMGCVINDYADIWLDGSVLRTKDRPLVSGKISPKQAIRFFLILAMVTSQLLWFLTFKAKVLAVLSMILLVCYPYSKRYIQAPQAFLGITFSMGIPLAYANASQVMDYQGIGLFVITVYWVIVYDVIYAMVDRADDKKMGVNSLALTLQDKVKPFIYYSYILIWILWGIWGLILAWPFYIFWCLLGINYYYQIQEVKMGQCFKAFLQNQQAGCLVFLGVLFGSL